MKHIIPLYEFLNEGSKSFQDIAKELVEIAAYYTDVDLSSEMTNAMKCDDKKTVVAFYGDLKELMQDEEPGSFKEFTKEASAFLAKNKINESVINEAQKDMMRKKCKECGKGIYIETTLMDDLSGILHCNKCDAVTERYIKESLDEATETIVSIPKLSDIDHTRVIKWMSQNIDGKYDMKKAGGGYEITTGGLSDNEVSDLMYYLKHNDYIKESTNEIPAGNLNRIDKNKSLKVGDVTTFSIGKHKGKKVKILKDLGNGRFELELIEESVVNEEASFADYEKAINKHDWYYSMSDDSRSYDRGEDEVRNIKKIYADLDDSDKKKAFAEFEKLSKKYYPHSTYKAKFNDFTGI